MRRGVCGLLLALVAIGCQMPTLFRVETDNRVRLDAPLRGSFAADLPPIRSTEPLEWVELERAGADEDRPLRGSIRSARIALVDVDGLLVNANQTGLYSQGENPAALFREKLDRCARDASVVAVVIRVNSPGGSVTATDLMVHDLADFRRKTGKPIVSCLMDVGCGSGYALAAVANQIVAHPGSIIGGLGVVLNLYNLQDCMATFNVIGQPIKAGELVDMGSPVKGLTPEARKLLQAMADEYHDHLRQLIRQHRPQLSTAADLAFDGRIMTARQALELGLIDRIGTMDAAIDLARHLAAPAGPGAVVAMLRRPGDPARSLYAITPNTPMQGTLMPLSVPGIDRSKLPTFMYAWLPEPTLERLAAGK
jgi:protease-4